MGQAYEVRVVGLVSEETLQELDGVTASVQDVATVLHGSVDDQAALFGLLARLRALGLELMELRRLPETDE